MKLTNIVSRFAAIAFLASVGMGAHAFPIGPVPPAASEVIEYFNVDIGHYFYTLDPAEIAAIDSGAEGAGWVKTGLVFFAYPDIASSGDQNFPTCDKAANPCVPIDRFYGTPGLGPNSHFYTGNAAEAAGLEQPGTGWTFEKVAFVLPLPDPATGQCSTTAANVYRMYNNRYMFNDSNHRYTTSPSARARMLAAGWIDEGVAFCNYGSGGASVASYIIQTSQPANIQDNAVCDASTSVAHPCIAVTNLPVPQTLFPSASQSFADQSADAFNGVTAIASLGNSPYLNYALPLGSREAAAQDVFVQLNDPTPPVQLNGSTAVFGLHVATPSKGPSLYSSLAPTMRLPDATSTTDARFFPFRELYGTNYQLTNQFQLDLNLLKSSTGSAALGAWMIEYQDSASGHRFRSTVLVYGTIPPGDFVAPDATDGVPIVGTSFSDDPVYGGPVLGARGNMTFYWTVNRIQFASALASARTIDPALSLDPASYFVRRFGLVNEVYGTGEIGATVYNAALGLTPIN